ncbi:MAG: hypothetical protein V4628_13715 [Pseudomonadota bacterium]
MAVMIFMRKLAAISLAGYFTCNSVTAAAQNNQLFIDPRIPAIDYFSAPSDVVTKLDGRLGAREIQLAYAENTGYLRALLDALDVPVESQIAVYSKTSLQKSLITSTNPRTIFFNDDVAVAWMAGGFIEVAALDPQKGAVFYSLSQARNTAPRLRRELDCLNCHVAGQTGSIPGFLVNSIPTAVDGAILPWLGNSLTNHRSPLEERWGGWYVTGETSSPHQGNMIVTSNNTAQLPQERPPPLASLAGQLDTKNYLSAYSDIVALLVFDHQMQMMNLLVRIGWEGKIAQQEDPAEAASALRATAIDVVDYMLFVDEAPLTEVRGSSGFTELFNTRGPFDNRGRSLRTLELQSRLMRYPCSYMIYSAAFAALPDVAKTAVYLRLAEVLFGADQSARYARFTKPMRQEIVDILRDTIVDLPDYFAGPLTY